MAGILIYTAAPDSEGTLGGLVELATPDRLGPMLSGALESVKLCGADPLCSEHDPSEPNAQATLHGAACHSCLLIAEPSCEKGNRYLDRGFLVDTLAERATAFFDSIGD